MSNPSGVSGMSIPRGISLPNTIHSEVAPGLPLPLLPVFCGALDDEIKLFDELSGSRSVNRSDVVSQASKIADLLQNTDVSYLNPRADAHCLPIVFAGRLDIYDEVLQCNSQAFEYIFPGPVKGQIHGRSIESEKVYEQNVPVVNQSQIDFGGNKDHQHDYSLPKDAVAPSRKPKVKKKGADEQDATERQDATVVRFCELLEDICGRVEIFNEDQVEAEWLPLSLADLKMLVNEIMSVRSKNVLQLIPVDSLVRLLRVLDQQIHRAEGLSINECEHSDSDAFLSLRGGMESIHAALAIMAHYGMPKQLYKEEVIERILEFSRHQIVDIMSACDPAYHALHKPSENGVLEVEDDDDIDTDFASPNKKRRTSRNFKVKKRIANKASASVNSLLQKMCTILGFLKDLLSIERLSDSCILQLVKTSFTTFLVENIELLQLKAISLISGIFYTYPQHRTYVMDEALHLLVKLPFAKRVPRTYHLPDEEQRQIQMITALLIQLVHCSANLPDGLRVASNSSSVSEISIDPSYPTKCHEAVTEACCLFWSRVLQRFTSTKAQDASESKAMMENLVLDLLTTLNLPEYPASAPILEVLCVLLLQNAGLKSKDIAARSMAIDLLGTIAARLKQDAVICRRQKFWIMQELEDSNSVDRSYLKDACSICLDPRVEKPFLICQACQRLCHVDCMGVRGHSVPTRSWFCPYCVCRKQLLALQSYCGSQVKDELKGNHDLLEKSFEAPDTVTDLEIVQQMLLNHVQDGGPDDDIHIFIRWFYLCLWYKDDPSAQKKLLYYIARLKSKAIVRDSGDFSLSFTRDSIKKISLALGQNNSFSRGFDKILHMLLASLRENSPVIRAKALRAVSIIVEADPEVLCDKLVQTAVEGRFCDSAISAREAALELVGRHIASHPDVGLKYFDKVAERIKDTGVSVRKRAIKIIRDMCTSNANFSEFIRACIEIISRLSDEESSIQDLVCKTFYEFWFEEPSGSHNNFYGDGSSVPLEIARKTEQMVETLRKMPNHQLLVTVIRRNLSLDFFPQSAKAVGINPLSLASVRRRCELMCKCLLERILQVEEMDKEEVDIPALPYMMLLHAFCVVDPTLCAPASNPSQFVVTLQSYLKSQADNRVGAQLLESIIFVIDSLLPLIRKLPHSFIEELEQDLKQMIVRHSFLTVVHACIKCLCSVCKVAGKGAAVIDYLIQVFSKHLDALGFDNKQQVGRSLFCLGLLIRYGNSSLSSTQLGFKSIDVGRSLNLFKRYLQAEDFVIKVRSLQALGYVLIARPEYMLEKDVGKILEATLSSSTDVRLKIQALQNICEYLLDAENQMGTDKANDDGVVHSMDGNQGVPIAAGAGDTNICGGIVQLYWDSILGRCMDVNEQVRQSALKIVEVVLRQGLVHPITCVPHLIALETDPQEANAKLAHHLLTNMNEKYPAFFESRLGDGLQLSFIFMRAMTHHSSENASPKVPFRAAGNLKGKTDGSYFTYAKSGVSRIYRLIRSNRASRNKFMSSVIRKFDMPSCNDSVIPFLTYCTEILALLPFTSSDEPLYLIYVINRVSQVRAGALEANMKAVMHILQSNGLKGVHGNGLVQSELCTQPVQEDVSSVNADPSVEDGFIDSHPSDQSAFVDNLDPVVASNSSILFDDLQKIQADCLGAASLQLLLKLKRHLKIVYSLNDARCQAFSPNEPLKQGEAVSRQNIPFNLSETRFDLPRTYQDLFQRYQEFKNALREDTIDYSIYTANIKKKRPPRRSGKGRLTGGEGHHGGEDDDDDSEDFQSGAQRVHDSGRKVVTRSRRLL